jgi:precorrin isomerase
VRYCQIIEQSGTYAILFEIVRRMALLHITISLRDLRMQAAASTSDTELASVLAFYDNFIRNTADQLARGGQLEQVSKTLRLEVEILEAEQQKNAHLIQNQTRDIERLAKEVKDWRAKELARAETREENINYAKQVTELKIEVVSTIAGSVIYVYHT